MSEPLLKTPCTFGENGNFLIERELGSGGMGGVYMGRDKMLDRPVAVKVMLRELGADAEFVEKFKREAQAAAKLIHPNIAQIYSYGICDGLPYIAMELVAGGSLDALIRANPGKTDVSRVIKICQQVAQALQCSTDQGFVHGDVKPENILLDANGNAKLVDFGLAAMQKDTDEIWGTPYYISPEKVKKEPVDFRADMYSLGGTLYHALTGVAPFEGDDSIAVVKARFTGLPKKPSEVRGELSPAIDALVMKMLALEKENRYPSFEALLEAFKDVLTTGLSVTAGAAAKPAAAKPATAGARRMAVRGRRVSMMRKKTSAAARADDEGKVSDATSADESGDSKKDDDEDEEEGGGNLGVKVVLFVVGGLLAIAAVVGGLFWFMAANKASERAAVAAQVQSSFSKARDAVDDTVSKAKAFADEFDAFAKRAIDEVEKPTAELKRILPADQAALLKPAFSKELLDAIASTNTLAAPSSAAVPATNAVPQAATNAPAAAATNAAPQAAKADAKAAGAKATGAKKTDPKAAKKDGAKKDAAKKGGPKKADAKKADAKKAKPKPEAEEKPPAPPSPTVIAMNELWERAYGCLASAIRIRKSVNELVAKGAEVSQYTEVTLQNAEKLADLSRTLVDLLEQIKGSKDVENVKKGITFIRQKGEKTVEQTLKRLRIEKLEADRKARAEAAAAAEKARLEKKAEEHKAKAEAETKAAADKFETIAALGSLRQLDWKNALRQLETLKADLTTPEGQHAADVQIRKVNNMKKVHDVFVKSIVGHTFRGKLKGQKVTSVSEKEIQLVKADGKTRSRLTWQKFYKDYPGNLNELLGRYVVNGRKNAKPALNLRDWADAMTGAALTLQIVCAEVNGATELAEKLAKESVKQFADYQKTAQDLFPDMKFEAAEE